VDLFLAICQGLGLALAIGVGGALAALFVSFMGSIEAGIDPDGTDFEFLTATWFLVALLALVVLAIVARTRDIARYPIVALLAAAGAICFAASLAEEGETAWWGLIAGAIVTALAAVIALDILEGAIQRAKSSGTEAADDAANTLLIAFAFGGIALAAISLVLPPVSLVALVVLIALVLGRRRKAGEKYEGLRILR
jgi:hypothetical protein